MAFKDPINEQIAQKVKTQLLTVTTGNGYNYSLAKVVRPTREGGYDPQHLLAVLEQRDRYEDEEQTHPYITWVLPFAVNLYVKPPDDQDPATDPVDQVVNRLGADVEKALMLMHPSQGSILAGLAFDCRIRAPEGFITADGAFEGQTVIFEVLYRHVETDPYDNGGS